MSTVLENAIAEALAPVYGPVVQDSDAMGYAAPRTLALSEAAAAACIAVVAALPADYTDTDILCYLRGEDVPSEPLPTHEVTA